jgi:hypothetical protein
MGLVFIRKRELKRIEVLARLDSGRLTDAYRSCAIKTHARRNAGGHGNSDHGNRDRAKPYV